MNYRGDQKRFNDSMKSFQLIDIPASRVFKKEGNPENEIDFERIDKFSKIFIR